MKKTISAVNMCCSHMLFFRKTCDWRKILWNEIHRLHGKKKKKEYTLVYFRTSSLWLWLNFERVSFGSLKKKRKGYSCPSEPPHPTKQASHLLFQKLAIGWQRLTSQWTASYSHGGMFIILYAHHKLHVLSKNIKLKN